MTEQRSILNVVSDLLAGLPDSVRRELHVSEQVHRFLRDTYAKAVDPKHAATMGAMPIVVDGDLSGGQWQLRENGETVQAGDMAPAPDGMEVIYSPHAGWVAVNSELLNQVVAGPASRTWPSLLRGPHCGMGWMR
ncbi:hypothetical protein AB0F72_09200 [Actinoplanes sp. NPDC023936]|uniref:hypothetical protein n=1 Tax=Actinoplanes sp. NPDC023936 TaxID=3154910 RepID=UPI0033C4C473